MFAHWRVVLALAAVGAGVAALVEGRAIDHPPGVLAADEPWQQLVQRPAFVHGDYQLTPRAASEIGRAHV